MSIWLCLLTVVCAVWWLLPLATVDDDMAFRFMIEPPADQNVYDYMFCRGDRIGSFADSLRSAVNHWFYVNGRLSDKLLIAGILLPVALVNAFIGVAVGLMPLIIAGAAGKWRSAPAVMIASVLMWLALPWTALSAERAYLLNYAVSGELLLSVIWMINSGYRGAALFILAFVAAWFHEIFGAALLIWILCKYICRPHDRWLLWVALCAAVGLALILCSPALWMRNTQEAHCFNAAELIGHLSRLSVGLLPVVVACMLIVVALLRHKLDCPTVLPWLAAILFGGGAAVYFLEGGRFLWVCNLLSVCVMISLAARLLPRLFQWLSGRYAVLVFVAVYVLWAWQLAAAQWQTSRQQALATSYLTDSHQAIVPVSWADELDFPWYVAAIVENPMVRTPNFAQVDGYAAGLGCDAVYVDPALIDKPFDQWPQLPGHNSLRGAGGNYFVPDSCHGRTYKIVFGEYTNSSSPVDRLLGRLRGDNAGPGLYQATCQGWEGDRVVIGTDTLRRFYFGQFQRGVASRRIVAVNQD